ncbi:MAG TPA: pyridoxal phosphate-dependent aminotransferase [Acidimicrobiales bacterium]|nr:pyridoxal phosphate-dependent aminotransferase [Acidimicrobiales bacterium]
MHTEPATEEPVGLRRAPLNSALSEFGTTIFAEMSALAVRTNAINLGQGFPDTDGPPEVAEAAIAAIRSGRNQYPPGRGEPELLRAVAEHQRRFYGLEFDPDREILVTAGATEAVAAAMLGLCEAGDEVVVFEPYYDSYAATIAMAGARRRVVPLTAPDWSFDPAALAAAVSDRTRLLLLNSPHNPTGKVFSEAELQEIARVCVEHDLYAVTDEVYEHLVYEGRHIPLASLPGMAERTVTISSAGKTFSFTGWKVGWACAPAPLLDAVRAAKQFLTYVSGAPFQPAIAVGLALGDAFYREAAASLQARRDLLAEGLSALGFSLCRTEGTYFLTTDITPLYAGDGVSFCLELPERCGVVAIPSSVFYDDKVRSRSLVRWAFCKRPDVLTEALGRLEGLTRS